MEKYRDFEHIQKQDISEFHGLDTEVSFTPERPFENLPLTVGKFGITYPNPTYYIKRDPAPCFILEYIVSGKGYLNVNDEKHTLKAGDAYIIHPGDFCIYHSDPSDPYKKYWVNFSASFFFTELLKAYDINDRVVRGLDLSGFFEDIFKLEERYTLNDEMYIPASKLIFGALMEIAQHKQKNFMSQEKDIAFKVRNLLYKSFATKITIDEVAKRFYRSKNDINRQFKKKYNTTPHNYLIDVRIGKAKNLLVNSKKTLAEIASFLCFSSEFHFSNTFKKKVGVSPSEFRKSHASRNKA